MAGRGRPTTDSALTAHDAKALSSQKSPLLFSAIQQALLTWFRSGHRDLPWRKERDPYAIWVSEIMLQQTRTETVKGYFSRFMARFPTVTALAEAPLDDVLSHWSGLGYYSRARNLHKAAQQIQTLHDGQFPHDPEAIAALPGIGPYTAGAIRSIALGQAAPILDGNVIRVLSRLFLLDERPDSAGGKRLYWSLAESLLPKASLDQQPNDPGDLNQALMELGATVCLPRRPVCLTCPLASHCMVRKHGNPEDHPPAKPQKVSPTVRMVTLLLRQGEQVLLVRRPELGLWGGLWEPPTLALESDEDVATGLTRLTETILGIKLPVEQAQPLPEFAHILTHRNLRFFPFLLTLGKLPACKLDGYQAQRFIDPSEPQALGLSAWVTALLARLPDPVEQPAPTV